MQWRNAEREKTEPVDREYATIRLDRADGSTLAVLFNYACHPVVMGEPKAAGWRFAKGVPHVTARIMAKRDGPPVK